MLGSGDLSVAQLLFFPQDTRFNNAEDLQACLHSEYLSSLHFCLPWLLPPEGKCLRQAFSTGTRLAVLCLRRALFEKLAQIGLWYQRLERLSLVLLCLCFPSSAKRLAAWLFHKTICLLEASKDSPSIICTISKECTFGRSLRLMLFPSGLRIWATKYLLFLWMK